MNSEYIFSIGVILRLAGFVLVLKGLFQFLKVQVKAYGVDPKATGRSSSINFVIGFVALVLSIPLVGKSAQLWDVPLFWPVIPFTGWVVIICGSIALVNLVKYFTGAGNPSRKSYVTQAVSYGLIAVVGAYFYHSIPNNDFKFLTGKIALSPENMALVLVLAILAVIAMALTQRSIKSRGWTQVVVTHITLIVGSIIFGMPFVWLLITSFKSDLDMTSTNGINWVPHVDRTVKYLDLKNPLLEGVYNGITVKGSILQKNKNGYLTIDVSEPASLLGQPVTLPKDQLKVVPKDVAVVTATYNGVPIQGIVIDQLTNGSQTVEIQTPENLKGTLMHALPGEATKIRDVGLNYLNYPKSLSFLPPEAHGGLVYLKNTLYLVVLTMIGTLLSGSIVAYAFSRMQFPGREFLFTVLLSTMMLPGAVTLLPQFLIFRDLGWIDTLRPLWVPAFFGSAFNIFLLRQFFKQIPMELEDAGKIDGCSYLRSFWAIMLPQVFPALAVIGILTFMGTWNNFMGPLIYVSTPDQMVISYAVQLFNGDHSGEPGLLMAFATMSMAPVLLLFFFAQRFFIEGVQLSGLGGR